MSENIKKDIEELQSQRDYYKREAESIWAILRKDQERNLKLAQKIVEVDKKAVANIILNMYFGKMPSDSCSFCEIFDLRGKGYCKEGLRCTDCIDNFLLEYYRKRLEAEKRGIAMEELKEYIQQKVIQYEHRASNQEEVISNYTSKMELADNEEDIRMLESERQKHIAKQNEFLAMADFGKEILQKFFEESEE